MERKAYPNDVTDDEWAFVAPYSPLMTEDAPQRMCRVREMFNGLRWLARAAAPWRMMPNELPPWEALYQQTRRRMILRLAEGRTAHLSATTLDS